MLTKQEEKQQEQEEEQNDEQGGVEEREITGGIRGEERRCGLHANAS